MADLIDREELLDELNWLKSQKPPSQQDEINDIIMRVKSQYHRQSKITVTMVEPKRGEWVTHKGAHGKNYTTCSNCNSAVALKLKNGSIERLDMTATNFCPNCGADMRKKENNDDWARRN